MTKEKKELTKWQKALIIIASILLVISIVSISWYAYIKLTGKSKIVENTFEIGDLEMADGTKENIFEIKYMANETGNGYEMFEIKFTNLLDETRTKSYSQGLQFVSNSQSNQLEWFDYEDFYTRLDGINYSGSLGELYESGIVSYKIGSSGALMWKKTYYTNYITPQINTDVASSFNYGSADKFENVIESSTYPLKNNPPLKITLDGEIYLMEFRGSGYIQKSTEGLAYDDDNKYIYSDMRDSGNSNRFYANYNYFTMAYELYKQIQTIQAGTNQYIIFHFDDWFNYSKYDNGEYKPITDREDKQLVIERIRNYLSIKVTISANGATCAEDSMFNALFGSPNYSLDGKNNPAGDYFTGKAIISVDLNDFVLINIVDNFYAMQLKEDFIKQYLPYKNEITLSIKINKTRLEELNIILAGFVDNSGLDNFEILEILEVENV